MSIHELSQEELDILLEEYINDMSELEKMVMEIAKDHLESSFSLENSVGFVSWYREKIKTLGKK